MPSNEFPPGAAWFQAVVERINDIVVAVDGDGRLLYGNPAVQRWLGQDPAEFVGRNIVDYVHPDDQARAIGSIAFDAATDEPTTPAPIRLVRPDGEVMSFDVMANPTLHDPAVGALVFVAREAGNQQVVDEVLEAMVTGAELETMVVHAAELMRRPFWSVESAVYFQDDDGRDRTVHTGLPDDLVVPPAAADELPWDQARRTGHPVILVGPEQLPARLRPIALAAGYRSCWAHPIPDPMHDRPACFTVWSPHDAEPALGQGQALGRTIRLLALALQQRDQQVRLVRAARQDRLTGLANRTRFLAALDRALAEAAADTFVLYIDLDEFKPINDRFGHAVGDRVLVEIAVRLAQVAGDGDLVARLGGDEFAVLTTRSDTDEGLLAYADQLIEAIARPIDLDGERLQVGASIGLAGGSTTAPASNLILEAADGAMYRAKRGGRNQARLAPRTREIG